MINVFSGKFDQLTDSKTCLKDEHADCTVPDSAANLIKGSVSDEHGVKQLILLS